MKIKIGLTVVINFIAIFAFSQTKLIHHKSHSGSAENFTLSIENNLFDIEESNFGQAPQMIIKTAALDSLIYLTDTSTIMVTREICRDEYRPKAKPEIWKAGRDTVYNHTLFTLKYELDSIKKTLEELYNFQNPVKEMTFVGYANEEPKLKVPTKKDLKKIKKKAKKKQKAKMKAAKKAKQKQSQQQQTQELVMTPSVLDEIPPSPPSFFSGLPTVFLIGIIAILSLLTGLFYWRFNQFSKSKLVD